MNKTTSRFKGHSGLFSAAVWLFACAVSAVQHVDVGFEAPVQILYGVNELGSDTNVIVYDKMMEDDETFYGITQKYGTNRLWISEAEAYKGARSLAASCYAVDTAYKDRAEFRSVQGMKDYALNFGQEMYYGYAMKIDTNSTPPTSGMHLMQAYQNNSESQIPVTLSFNGVPEDGVWRFNIYARTLSETELIRTFTIPLGVWKKFVWRLRPAYPGMASGLVSLWVDGEEMVSWTGHWGHEPGDSTDQTLDLRCGIYRGSCDRQQTVYFDQIKYADSYYEADPDAEIDWSFRSDSDGWTVRKDIENLIQTNNCIEGTLSGPDCGLLSPDNLNLDCANRPYIVIGIKNSTASANAAFYFATSDSPTFSQDKRIEHSGFIPNDEHMTLYEFDMASNSNWTGVLKQLRFDPVDQTSATSGTFSIDFVDLTALPLEGGDTNQPVLIAGTDDFNRANTIQTAYTVNAGGTGWTQSDDGGPTGDDWLIKDNALRLRNRAAEAILYNTGLETQSGGGTGFTLKTDVMGLQHGTYTGIVFNYADEDNYYVIRFRTGFSTCQLLQKTSSGQDVLLNTSLASGTFAEDTYYTLTVTSDAAGVFDFTIDETGAGPVVSLTRVDNSASPLTGGYAGLYGNLTPPGHIVNFDNFRLTMVEKSTGFVQWAAGWSVDIGAATSDYDDDGLNNLYEYGLGGDPTNGLDQGTAPVSAVVNLGAAPVFQVVYPQLADPESGLTYHLETRTNLVSGVWTRSDCTVTGTNSTGSSLNFVTNTVELTEPKKFVRLMIAEEVPGAF
jgi:hypothetical protein